MATQDTESNTYTVEDVRNMLIQIIDKDKSMTALAISQATGIAHTSVTRFKSGKRGLTPLNFMRLLNFLDLLKNKE